MTIPGDVAQQGLLVRSFIQGKWDSASGKADDAYEIAMAEIMKIAALGLPSVSVPSVDWEDMSADFDINLVKPPTPEITFNWPDGRPIMGLLQEYPAFTFPLSDFNALNAETIAAIRRKLAAGGTGLGAVAEAALWARMRSRNDLKNENAYQEALNFFASRGFDAPPGALAASIASIRAEILRSETDLNNDIVVESAKLMADNERFIHELALKAATEYQRSTIEVIAAQNKSVVDVFVSSMEGYKADIQAEASRVDAIGKAIVAIMDGFKAEAMAAATVVEAKAKELDARIKLQVAKADVTIKTAEIEIEVVKFVWATQIEVFKAIATIASQLAASAMAAVNASVSSSFSGNAAEGVSFSENSSYDKTKEVKSLSESWNHSYDETKNRTT